MSVTLHLKQTTRRDLARILDEGVGAGDLGLEDAARAAEAQMAKLRKLELLYLADAGRAPLSPTAREFFADHLESLRRLGARQGPAAAGPELELDDSWRLLHYLFTGDAWESLSPAATLLAGGQETGEDLGLGPPRAVSVEETGDFAAFLRGLDLPGLMARLDERAMAALGATAPEARDEMRAALEYWFPRLRAFLDEAETRRRGLLVWMV
jgi:hypothetical protein